MNAPKSPLKRYLELVGPATPVSRDVRTFWTSLPEYAGHALFECLVKRGKTRGQVRKQPSDRWTAETFTAWRAWEGACGRSPLSKVITLGVSPEFDWRTYDAIVLAAKRHLADFERTLTQPHLPGYRPELRTDDKAVRQYLRKVPAEIRRLREEHDGRWNRPIVTSCQPVMGRLEKVWKQSPRAKRTLHLYKDTAFTRAVLESHGLKRLKVMADVTIVFLSQDDCPHTSRPARPAPGATRPVP